MSYEQFLELFYEETPQDIMKDVVSDKKKYYYDPKGNLEWCKKQGIDPVSVGRYLGEQKRTFRPSPFGVELASKNSNKGVVLDEKGAWLFVCGRDIFARAIVGGEPEKGTAAFLYDLDNNLLGYGVWVVHTLKQKNQPAIMNKTDKGLYLRA